MIHIDFPEPDYQEWKDWRRDCDGKRLEMESKGRPAKIGRLYKKKEIKEATYFATDGPFHGKCAYCEAYITDFQSGGGDMEHFRPKLKVTDENDDLVPGHGGYYWLAYYWRNLLPSCQTCNRPKNQPDGEKIGKRNRFPISGKRAAAHDDPLDDEEPMFLNPIDDDPAEHLTVNLETFELEGTSARGEMTIRLLGLNREQLPILRRQAVDRINAIWARMPFDEERAESELREVLGGTEPCTLASRERFDQLTGRTSVARGGT